ncbi:MAG: tripartite tricarboxylate transporter substrate binding protein [Deltaproteobacteria bacterium]|nr:tripartite tricarboxylate transporter substrate binding protein [Deltaproteobacteria bacterium]
MKSSLKISLAIMVTFLFGIMIFSPALAAYPEKPITVICPMSAGGPMDVFTRALCAGAEKILGQPLVVVNKPGGGGGSVGLGILAGEDPDGYNLILGSSTGIIIFPLRMKAPFKPLASFTSILGVLHPSAGIQVKPDSPFNNFQELIDYGRKNPGKLKYSTSGTGTPIHLSMVTIQRKENFKWTEIPFGGSSEELTALLGGHVDLIHTGVMYAVKGQTRLLAVSTYKRLKQFPDVPTLFDLGYDYYNNSYFGIWAPAGLEPEKVSILEDAFEKAMDTPAVQKAVDNTAMLPRIMRSKELTKFLEDLWTNEAQRLKEVGLLDEVATQPR